MGRRCTGSMVTYHKRLIIRMPFPYYGVELTVGSMATHRRRMYGTEPEFDCNIFPVSQTEHIMQVFNVSFPKVTSHFSLPFPVCPGSLQTWNGLQKKNYRHHLGDSLWIFEKHPTPFTKCKKCGIQVPL